MKIIPRCIKVTLRRDVKKIIRHQRLREYLYFHILCAATITILVPIIFFRSDNNAMLDYATLALPCMGTLFGSLGLMLKIRGTSAEVADRLSFTLAAGCLVTALAAYFAKNWSKIVDPINSTLLVVCTMTLAMSVYATITILLSNKKRRSRRGLITASLLAILLLVALTCFVIKTIFDGKP